LVVEPIAGHSSITLINFASYRDRRVMKDKTILYRLPARAHFRPSQSNTLLAAEIFFNEPALLITHDPATDVLRSFTARVRTIINEFP
jgi:hypothetical protein